MSVQVPSFRPGLDRFLRGLSESGMVADVIHRLVEAIGAEVGMSDDPELVRVLDRAAHASVADIESFLTGTRDSYILAPEGADLARTLALRGLGAETLINAFSVVRATAVDAIPELIEQTDASGHDRVELMIESWRFLTWWLDASMSHLLASHAAERELIVHRSATQRLDAVRAILSGTLTSTDQIIAELRHPIRRQQSAWVLWDVTPPDDGTARLHRFVQEEATARGAQALVVTSGSNEAWAWLATDRALLDDDLDPVAPLPDGVFVTIGRSEPGVEGFRRSHREAQAARRVHGATAAVTRYDVVELVHLLSGDPEALATLVARELGALAAPDPTAGQLRETLRAYFAANLRVREAADALGVHPNTVRYRLGLAEELLGRPVDSRRLHLELALLSYDRF